MKILLFCDFALPDSCANATRVINFAKILRELGHDIELLGVSYRENEPLSGECTGIPYQMIKAKEVYGIRAWERIRGIDAGLREFLSESNVAYDAILLSDIYFDHSGVVLQYAKKNNTKLIFNSVEWYDNSHFKGVNGKLRLIKIRYAIYVIHRKMGNILAISSLLDDYYKKRGCNTVTIPTIVDMEDYEGVACTEPSSEVDMLNIAYAGTPGRKDYIANAILAIGMLSDEERSRIKLNFYGPTFDQLYGLGISDEYLDRYKDSIVCHGRIPYTEVKSRIAAADFTVLLRPDKRYANAGFPTKVGESMACGTPVIANITSDLGEYILDGETGIVCKDETPESCAEGFRRALAMTREQKAEMRSKALQMARDWFDYRVYKEQLGEFIRNLK